MGWFGIGIASVIAPIAIIVGIIVVIIRASSGQGRGEGESGGVHVRRFFIYLMMLATLVLVGVGVAGLVEAALPSESVALRSSAAAARSIAFVLVAGPAYAGLWWYTARRLATDPRERASAGWAFYLIIALIGSLIAVMSFVGEILAGLVDGDAPDRNLVIHAVVWAAVWIGHWLVSQRYRAEPGSQVHLLIGSAVGLWVVFAGLFGVAAAVLLQLYETMASTLLVADPGLDDLLEPTVVLVVGAPVWWWYWIRHARSGTRNRIWHAYALLVGVLTGVVATVTGAGIAIHSVLAWFIADPVVSASRHFDVVPGALAAMLVGGATWVYHAHAIGTRERPMRSEVDRVYGYLVAGSGLVVAASGIATLIAGVLVTVGGRGTAAIESDETIAVALTLLVVGAPLWWWYWSSIQRHRRSGGAVEITSISRRIYLVILFGVAAIVAVVNLIVIVFIGVEDMLDGVFGKVSVESTAVSLALVMTAGVVAWYHWAVFREDRADLAGYEPSGEPDAAVGERLMPDRIPVGDLEAKVVQIAKGGATRIVVSIEEDGYTIEDVGFGLGSDDVDQGPGQDLDGA